MTAHRPYKCHAPRTDLVVHHDARLVVIGGPQDAGYSSGLLAAKLAPVAAAIVGMKGPIGATEVAGAPRGVR